MGAWHTLSERARSRVTRSHLINARTSRKRGNLRRETVQTQPNHHFPLVSVVRVLWFFCHKTIYEITSSSHLSGKALTGQMASVLQEHAVDCGPTSNEFLAYEIEWGSQISKFANRIRRGANSFVMQ